VSLPVPNLDDRTFQQLVDEAKRRIPTYCPEWTNHNLSDPGVALIELFAWMSEMMLYRLNQVPDAFYTRMLNLLGIETFAATAATAELTFWIAGTDQEMTIAAGTEVATVPEPGSDPVVFTTAQDLTVVAPRLTHLLTSANEDFFAEVTTDVAAGQPTSLFTNNPLRTGDAFYFGFEHSLAGNVIELRIGASVQGIGVDPNRPPVAWQAWTGEGWAGVEVNRDTTGGFNRDGIVRLLIPLAHEPLTLGQYAAHWVRVALVEPDVGQPAYRSSPQVTSVAAVTVGATIPAEHSAVAAPETLGISNGEPAQVFTVSHTPVMARRPGETIEVVEADGATVVWNEVSDFQESGDDDTDFVWDSATGEIRFGPRIRSPKGKYRQHGAVPPAGATVQVTRYRHGGGARGNVGAGTLVSLQSAVPGVSRVENLQPAANGVDAESVENAKERGPMTLRAGGRAVTVEDYERLAMQSDPAIARARCLPPTAPGEPVRLHLVPHVDRTPGAAPLIDEFALPEPTEKRVMAYLDERRILGTGLSIGTPYYQGVSVAALIKVLPGRPGDLVRGRALDALYEFIDPLGGGLDGEGWPFGLDLNAAAVAQLLADVDGVEQVEDVVFFPYDVRNRVRQGRGLEIVRLEGHALFLSAEHRVVTR
jgi:predicted phage baseplate assembly protein